MSRNRAFRLLKDARIRASATSVGGTSSRVGQTAAVNANLASAHPEGVRNVSLQIVQQRMKSVSNIQKITKAMKMVAASRLKPAQDKAMASRGMVTPFYKLLGDLPGAETAKTLMVPISSDKGLCGGINGNVVKVSNVLLDTAKDKESEVSMDVIGDKARGLMQRQVGDLFSNVMVDATKQPLTFGTASALAEQVAKDNEGKAHIVYNRFVSAISFKPTIATVLSGEEYEKAAENLENKFDSYEVEGPDRAEFLLDLAEFKTGAVMYNALAENNTSELGSRMQSMESSSKNASEMLSKLTLLYNRTRQAAITTELIEIISGASALEDAK
jgi:F-type H+-transporting ATPase subunit gamma